TLLRRRLPCLRVGPTRRLSPGLVLDIARADRRVPVSVVGRALIDYARLHDPAGADEVADEIHASLRSNRGPVLEPSTFLGVAMPRTSSGWFACLGRWSATAARI